jgi:hypothetical protein
MIPFMPLPKLLATPLLGFLVPRLVGYAERTHVPLTHSHVCAEPERNRCKLSGKPSGGLSKHTSGLRSQLVEA